MAYALHSRQRSLVQDSPGVQARTGDQQLTEIRRRPHLLFRSTAMGPSFGRLSVVALDALDGVRHVTELPCERVYASAGSGLCLQASRGVFTSYRAVMFDQELKPLHTFNLAGTPSRTRISGNGRMAATTVFVRGDSYNSGGFSTRTNIIDLSTKEVLGDLESFTVTRDGEPFRKVDFNFWGVTFTPDGERFYATLNSGGIFFLVDGDIEQRSMRVIHEGVECPSLSPNNARLAFKSRTSTFGRLVWNLRVLNMATGGETTISEERSVDDQVEWLDDDHVLYALPDDTAGSASSNIWIARADGTGVPRIFLANAASPCVVRP